MIRKAGHELVLYYNPEVSSKVMKLKGVLVRMGVRIRNVAPEQVLQQVGTLAGISVMSAQRMGLCRKQSFRLFRMRCW